MDASPALHLLLVDDVHQGMIARKTILQESGYRISTASTVEDAFTLISEYAFALVVINHQPPALDGLEFVQRFRAEHPGVKLILISGLAETLGLTEASTGADIVIQKNAGEVQMLIRSANRLLRRRIVRKPPLRLAATTSGVIRKSV